MLHLKGLKTSVLVCSALVATLASTIASAKSSSQNIESMLHSPGAHELMADEAALWSRSIETHRLSVRQQVAPGGAIILRGNPSPAQRFSRGKLFRCDVRLIGSGQFVANRASCDIANPVFVPLSANGVDQPTAVTPGYYVLGFENSMYPGFLQITAGQPAVVQLTPITIPAGGSVKVYRDLNSLTEEVKMYFSTYVLGQSLFTLSEYSFGDLYLKAFGTRDGMVPLDYKTCETRTPELTQKGTRICRAWNMGTFMSLAEMFDFAGDGSFTQYELGKQGKPYPYKIGRLLVAKRTSASSASFVNVLPGQYTVEVTGDKGAVTRTSTGAVGSATLSADLTKNIGWVPPASKLTMVGDTSTITAPAAIDPQADPNAPSAALMASSDDGAAGYMDPNETCGSAKLWRTELRSYCTSDSSAGCSRSSAKVCEPMAPISQIP